jgi:hypothetical protein
MTLQIWHGVDVEHTPKIFVSTSKAPLNPSVSIGWKDSRTTAYPETASAHGSYEALLDDPAGRRRRVRPAPHQPPRALGHRRRSAWQVPAAREAHRALQRRPRRHPRRLRCRRRTVHGLYYMDASPAYRQDAGVRREDAIGDIKLVSFLEQRLR